MAEIIGCFLGYDHFGFKDDPLGLSITYAMKQAADVASPAALFAHRQGGTYERSARQRAQKVNRVKQIRLAHSVGACDTREGAKVHVNVNQVFEATNRKSSQHVSVLMSSARRSLA
ncbi:MAG: hypothetical protein NZM18_10595 [Thermoflexales bacterium]|nr:hypothetical protein [Thermoflexales bacterium]